MKINLRHFLTVRLRRFLAWTLLLVCSVCMLVCMRLPAFVCSLSCRSSAVFLLFFFPLSGCPAPLFPVSAWSLLAGPSRCPSRRHLAVLVSSRMTSPASECHPRGCSGIDRQLQRHRHRNRQSASSEQRTATATAADAAQRSGCHCQCQRCPSAGDVRSRRRAATAG